MGWIEKTLEEFEGLLSDDEETVTKFVRAKLLESYKNGAAAERRKAFTRSPNAGTMKVYGKK